MGIERVDQIVRFDYGRSGLTARGQPIATKFPKLPYNKSLECLEFVPKGLPLAGTLIVVTERGLDANGNLLSFLIKGTNFGDFTVKRTDDFDVSDCALLPGGDLLILERRYSPWRGVAMRIRRLPMASIKPGALVDGPILIYADMGFQIDNMEGLSVHRAADGNLVLCCTLVSDDNFSLLQRTILLQFTLRDEIRLPGLWLHVRFQKWGSHDIRWIAGISRGRPPTIARPHFGELLGDLPLEVERLGGKLVLLRLHQEGVEAAAVIDGLERVGRDAQLHRAAERVGHQGDVDQVRQEAPKGLAVRMAHLVAGQRALAGQFASPRHGRILKTRECPEAGRIENRDPKSSGGRGRIVTMASEVKNKADSSQSALRRRSGFPGGGTGSA